MPSSMRSFNISLIDKLIFINWLFGQQGISNLENQFEKHFSLLKYFFEIEEPLDWQLIPDQLSN